ncbi:MAG: outer membrane protein transport protein [Betaproteobacteria bacterium]
MKSNWRYSTLAGAVTAALGSGATSVDAAGFFLPYQGAAAIGNSLAGTAALGEDASTVFWNPAGMSRIQTRQISVAGHYSDPSIDFTDKGSTGPAAIVPATGGNGGDAGTAKVIPNVFAVLPFGAWAVGIGVSAPFGNKTEYEPSWRGRFQSTESELTMINVNPSVSYQATPTFALGFGINYAKMEAEFHQGAVLGVNTEGSATLTGDSTAWGLNAGLLWQATDETRLGFSYRSKMDFELSGNRQVLTAGGAAVPGQNFTIEADLTVPAIAQLSVVHELNDNWSLLGDIMFTQWSEVNELVVKRQSTGGVSDRLAFQFKDAWRGSVAVNYRVNDGWLLRSGVAYDQSPVKGAGERPTSLPDSDRIWVSFGARWDIAPAHRLDVAYARVIIKDSDINRSTTGTASAMTLTGGYSSSANILSAQYTFSF